MDLRRVLLKVPVSSVSKSLKRLIINKDNQYIWGDESEGYPFLNTIHRESYIL